MPPPGIEPGRILSLRLNCSTCSDLESVFCGPCRNRTGTPLRYKILSFARIPISPKGHYFLLFFPAYVSVCAWQFGQRICKFSKRLSVFIPLMWWTCNGIGLPFHSVLPQISHFLSLYPPINNRFRKLFEHLYGEFCVNTTESGMRGKQPPFLPLFQTLPVKWEISIPNSTIFAWIILYEPPNCDRPRRRHISAILLDCFAALINSASVFLYFLFIFFVAPPRFERGIQVPKTWVLPLHHGASCFNILSCGRH